MFEDDKELEAKIRREFNRMRGRLLGFLEAVGMPEKQEEGAKATLKSLSYDAENLIIDLIFGDDRDDE